MSSKCFYQNAAREVEECIKRYKNEYWGLIMKYEQTKGVELRLKMSRIRRRLILVMREKEELNREYQWKEVVW
tara:strand:+ start:62 stop:280 length:219 start_codon:yes stop_codon:yes gene_type:complete